MFCHPFPFGASRTTASAIDGAFLEAGIYDPLPGVDSLLERIRALALRLPPSPEREALIFKVDGMLVSSSTSEICGAARSVAAGAVEDRGSGRHAKA